MALIDLAILGATVAAAVWGYWQGLRTGAFVLIGFGVGAVVGSRVAPLLLEGGLHDPYAGVLAVPGALLFGALLAAALERFGFGLRRLVPDGGMLDVVGGALLAGGIGLVGVWLLAAAATRVDGLSRSVRSSTIIERLNSVLPPPGPLVSLAKPPDPLPVIAGPGAGVGPASPRIKFDPDVRSAARSVVKVSGAPCGQSGSGWIAADGVVVTNAHVVQGNDQSVVQLEGRGESRAAEAIWFDDVNDIALLRVPGVAGEPPLPIDASPNAGTFAAVLGFPGGGPYRASAARVGNTSRIPGFKARGARYAKRRIVSIRAAVRSGNSGGPVVDGRGRVETMVFAARKGGHAAYGVPASLVQKALRRAERPVDTGKCSED